MGVVDKVQRAYPGSSLTTWTTLPQVPVDAAAFQTQATVPAATPQRSFHRIRFDGVDAYGMIETP